jgi:hypothetical protein
VTSTPPGAFVDTFPAPDVNYACPNTSEVGTVTVSVPEVTGDLSGKVYLGAQQAGDFSNPAFSLYHLYIYAVRGGVTVKFQGTAKSDAATGQVTVTVDNDNAYFDGLPQFNYLVPGPTPVTGTNPVSNPSDPQQMLVNPQTCTTFTNTANTTSYNSAPKATLSAWTGEPDKVVQPTNLQTTSGSCSYAAFNPTFSAYIGPDPVEQRNRRCRSAPEPEPLRHAPRPHGQPQVARVQAALWFCWLGQRGADLLGPLAHEPRNVRPRERARLRSRDRRFWLEPGPDDEHDLQRQHR